MRFQIQIVCNLQCLQAFLFVSFHFISHRIFSSASIYVILVGPLRSFANIRADFTPNESAFTCLPNKREKQKQTKTNRFWNRKTNWETRILEVKKENKHRNNNNILEQINIQAETKKKQTKKQERKKERKKDRKKKERKRERERGKLKGGGMTWIDIALVCSARWVLFDH